MKARVILPVFLAVIAGLGSLVVMMRMRDNMGQEQVKEETKPVVVAAVALQPTQDIRESAVMIKGVPVSMLPEEYHSEIETVVGRVLRSHVPAGYPVTEACLQPEGTAAGFDAKIPAGYRAVAVKVDEWSSVAGFVVPGSHVDVIAEVTHPQTRRKRSKTILQNVEVAAVGSITSRAELASDETGERAQNLDRRSVTLFLTPREAEVLHEANVGRLLLTLRSGVDDSIHESPEDPVIDTVAVAPPVNQSGQKAPEKAKPRDPKKFVTWEIKGDTVEQVTYVYINGAWERENTDNAYGRGILVEDSSPLPRVKTSDDENAAGTEPTESSDDSGGKD